MGQRAKSVSSQLNSGGVLVRSGSFHWRKNERKKGKRIARYRICLDLEKSKQVGGAPVTSELLEQRLILQISIEVSFNCLEAFSPSLGFS
jgi:hypothetical protein